MYALTQASASLYYSNFNQPGIGYLGDRLEFLLNYLL